MRAPEYFVSKEQIQKLREKDLRQKVIIPLMVKMGYEDAFGWHGGPGELGKDVVGSRLDDFGELSNVVAVAKAVRIVGKTAIDVARQVQQAFNTKFKANLGNDERSPHKVWVVTNHDIPKESRDQILSSLDSKLQPHVIFIDIDTLWSNWQKHFPPPVYLHLSQTQQLLKAFESEDPAMRRRVWIESDAFGADFKIVRPELLNDERIDFSAQLRFPDTPEGRAKLADLQAMLKSGIPLEIPGQFVSFQLPEAIKRPVEQLFGISQFELTSILISPFQPDHEMPVSISLDSSDGDYARLDYIDCRVFQDDDEIILSNEDQPIPIRVRQSVSTDGSGTCSIKIKKWPVPVIWLKKWLDVLRVASKPGRTTITHLPTGRRIARAYRQPDPAKLPSQESLDLVSDLATIQELLGQPIYFPGRPLTEAEHNTVTTLRTLLHKPTLVRTWLHCGGKFTAKDVKERLEPLLRGECGPLYLEEEEYAELADITFSLGRVQHHVESARIINPEDVLSQLAQASDDNAPVSIQFVPGTNNLVHTRFLNLER